MDLGQKHVACFAVFRASGINNMGNDQQGEEVFYFIVKEFKVKAKAPQESFSVQQCCSSDGRFLLNE